SGKALSGSGSRPTCRVGRPRRNRESERACCAAARLLRRQALAALGAAALEDEAAGTRLHPVAEAVLLLPAAHVRLVGPFHLESPIRRGEKPAVAGRGPV